ncbi:MAG: hypothetical protein VB858_13195, partial [Planctomycetaceae bacterium]
PPPPPGIDRPDVRFDGHSLVPILKSADAQSEHHILHFQWQQRWAVREGDWKLIQHTSQSGGKDRFELVSLADQKPEQADHSAEQPAIVERLRKHHAAFVKDVFAGRPGT